MFWLVWFTMLSWIIREDIAWLLHRSCWFNPKLRCKKRFEIWKILKQTLFISIDVVQWKLWWIKSKKCKKKNDIFTYQNGKDADIELIPWGISVRVRKIFVKVRRSMCYVIGISVKGSENIGKVRHFEFTAKHYRSCWSCYLLLASLLACLLTDMTA